MAGAFGDEWRKRAFDSLTQRGFDKRSAALVTLALSPLDETQPPHSEDFRREAERLASSFGQSQPQNLDAVNAAAAATSLLEQIRRLAHHYGEPHYSGRYDSILGVEPVQPEPVQPEPVQPEPVQPEPVQPEPVQPEPVQPYVPLSAAPSYVPEPVAAPEPAHMQQVTLGEDDFPVEIRWQDDPQRNRLFTLLVFPLVIPHLIVSWLLAIPALIVMPLAWVAALITGSVPAPLHNYLAALHRFGFRVGAFLSLLAGPYPPLGLGGAYPTDVVYAPPAAQSRLKTFFRLFIGGFFQSVAIISSPVVSIVLFAAWLATLATGSFPAWAGRIVRWHFRYNAEVNAYVALLHDRTPRITLPTAGAPTNNRKTYLLCAASSVGVFVIYAVWISALLAAARQLPTGPNGYPASARGDFISGCEQNGGTETLCGCVFDGIAAQVSYNDFVTYSEAAHKNAAAGDPRVARIVVNAAATCAHQAGMPTSTSPSSGK